MLNPNPPRLVTVVIALALVLVGLSATVFPIDFVNEALAVGAVAGVAGYFFGSILPVLLGAPEAAV